MHRVTPDPPVEPATRVCYRHPERETRLSCSRCGRPICAACSIDAAVGQRCPQCVAETGPQTQIPVPPRRPRRVAAGLPPVTKGILVVTIVMYFLQGQVGDLLIHHSGLVAEGQFWRIFTTTLLHASFTHILFNMWALYVLGPQVERGVGSKAFLALYLASAGMGGVAAQLLTPGIFSAVGASGAVFGLFGVWLNLAVRRRNTAWGRSLLSQLGFILLINAALPIIFPRISWQAHLGGFIAGFLIGELWSRVKGPRAEAARALIAAAVAVVAAAVVLVV
ncbi:MAG TPA: rhomboid family intramembrane serine protease [Acidimicrobiia bacterium]|nr:rhomboid family intramembrane serine protease [Acidimicrobiia bacterium]